MFQRDYILRLAEQLAKTLGAVLTLKKARRFDEAERVVAEAARNLVGLDIDTLLALPIDQIVTLFSPGGSLDTGKCLVVADILDEHGDIQTLQRDDKTAYLARMRALGLLLEVSGRGELMHAPNPDRYRSKIEILTETLEPYAPSFDIQKRLIRHHERHGHFAEAEDVLFDLIDSGHEELIGTGIALYRRLLAKSDDELESGNLPRAEVEDGLAQLEARAGA